MVNAESSPNIKQETGWDDLAKGPAEVVDEPKKDAEYYRNNRSEISRLASEIIQLRGGVDAVMRAPKVDKNGIPTSWSGLCMYMRKNPDAIETIVAERDSLLNKDSESLEEDGIDKTNEEALDEVLAESEDTEAEDAAVEDETELPVPDNISEMPKAEKTGVKPENDDSMEIAGFELMTTDQQLDEINNRVDTIYTFQKQSSAWDKMAQALKRASAGVQAKVGYLRSEFALNRDKASLKQHQDRLRSISPVMPWSKNAEEAKTLKSTIDSMKRSISYQESQLALKKTMMADKLSDEDEQLVSKFRALDARMDRVNEDLHIREHTRDIKMREQWIRYQEEYMAKDKETGGKEANTFAKRYEQIAKWKQEIEGYKQRIADYQKAHPDFVLDLSKKVATATEQKKAA
jgi:hypothetical protein